MCVVALAASLAACDRAFFLLEGWAKEVSAVAVPTRTPRLSFLLQSVVPGQHHGVAAPVPSCWHSRAA